MLQIIIILLAVAADRLTKIFLGNWLLTLSDGSYQLIPGVINLTYVQNRGVAFGLFQNSRIVIIILTCLILAAGLYFMVREWKNRSLLFKISVALVIGGAIGNLYDRIFLTYVVDFIEFAFVNFAVFNVADSCVVIGAILFAFYYLFIYEKQRAKALRDE